MYHGSDGDDDGKEQTQHDSAAARDTPTVQVDAAHSRRDRDECDQRQQRDAEESPPPVQEPPP